MKHKKFFTALAAVLYLAVLSFASLTPVLAEEIDWEQLEAEAERILKAEGHDVSGILRVEGEIAPQSDSGLASDEYWIMFYDTREGDLSKYRIRLTDQGVLTGLDTDNPEGKGVKIINDPDYRFVDAQQLKKAHLLGFSDGGNIAMDFALRYPERVDRLILNGANLNPAGVKKYFAVQLD